MVNYVALYCRISQDKSGRVEGVKSQEKWGRAYAAERWPGVPVRVFADNDISAASGEHRPGFEDLREALARREVGYLWAVEQSRLERRELEWFRLAAELAAAGITELHTKRDGIVGVLDVVAGIKAVINAAEVRTNKKRLMDTLAEKAAQGLPAGSRPYGYVHGVNERGAKTLHQVPAEAAVIRESAARVLAGWSLTSIAVDLRARGLHGPHRVKARDANGEVATEDGIPVEDGGKPVTHPSTITERSVRSWVRNPTVAGMRVHRGEIVGPGNWEAILEESTWRSIGDKLAAPRIVRRANGGTYPVSSAARNAGRRYLLTGGTATCGVCLHPLVASMKQLRGDRVIPYYLCHPTLGGRGCIGIMGEKFEEYVVGEMLDKLDKPEFRDALETDDQEARREEIDAALEKIRLDRKKLASRWARVSDPNRPTDEEWEAAREVLHEEEQTLRAELVAIPPAKTEVDLDALRADWGAMTLDEKRHHISTYIDRVIVKRAKPGTQGFDAGRVEIVFRAR